MRKSTTGIITLSILLLALATPCVWLGLVNRQKRLDRALFEAIEKGTGEDVRRAVENGGRLEASVTDLLPIQIHVPYLERHQTTGTFFIANCVSYATGIRLGIFSWNEVRVTAYGQGQAIHRAASQSNTDALKALLELGVKPDAPTDKGRQPIHFAALYLKRDAITLLLASGAKASAKDIDGKTAADLAKEQASGILSGGSGSPPSAAERQIAADYLSLAAYLEAQAAKEQPPPPTPK